MVEFYLATGRNKDALRLLKEMSLLWNSDEPYRIQFYTQNGMALKGTGMLKDSSSEFLKAVTFTEEMRKKVKGEKVGFLGAGGAGGKIRAYRGLFSMLAERAIQKTEDRSQKTDKIKKS
jgi:hypothetical protein